MSWLREKLRAWLGIEEQPVIGLSESVVVPAGHQVNVKVNSKPGQQTMVIVATPKKGKNND
jgi:hypothetical protein